MAQPRRLDARADVDSPPRVSVPAPSARAAYHRLYRWVAASDAFAIEFALLSAYWIRFGVGMPTKDFGWLLLGAPRQFTMRAIVASIRSFVSSDVRPARG